MRAALPRATYFGFTGTPIDRGIIGRGTFETFGKPDPDGYLDRYGIDKSIEDGTTVPSTVPATSPAPFTATSTALSPRWVETFRTLP
jgi:type I site-specific restriction-modification system R (restriction) subunit